MHYDLYAYSGESYHNPSPSLFSHTSIILLSERKKTIYDVHVFSSKLCMNCSGYFLPKNYQIQPYRGTQNEIKWILTDPSGNSIFTFNSHFYLHDATYFACFISIGKAYLFKTFANIISIHHAVFFESVMYLIKSKMLNSFQL